jgi:hypothetical protein
MTTKLRVKRGTFVHESSGDMSPPAHPGVGELKGGAAAFNIVLWGRNDPLVNVALRSCK